MTSSPFAADDAFAETAAEAATGDLLQWNVADSGWGKIASSERWSISDDQGVSCFESLRGELETRHRELVRLRSLRTNPGRAPSAPRYLIFAQVDLSNNSLGDLAIRSLVSAALGSAASLRDLRLQRNRIGTAGAHALSTLISKAAEPPHEIHLSHNFIPPVAVKLMLLAAAGSALYPLKSSSGNLFPLWLRVEQQRVHWPQFTFRCEDENRALAVQLLKQIDKLMDKHRREAGHPPAIPTCLAPKSRCNTRNCEAPNVLVHLPYFWSQGIERFEKEIPSEAMLHTVDSSWESWYPSGIRDRSVPSNEITPLDDDTSSQTTSRTEEVVTKKNRNKIPQTVPSER
eukprot:TRINITY_DN73642_c0_g1_i1.p1 TRINITY_DN73642_c0_g1~~TRINITY_DN73642_c0_g1_i1.p1  ORF type:complete len:344 (+),score=43.20 TRINITY_DN73642_c0_g1_i1:69-1100(+)